MGNSFEKVFIGNAGSASDPLDITDVFSTFLYSGTGQGQAIDNGIDLDGEGGMVWIKKRNARKSGGVMSTAQGLDSNSNSRYVVPDTTAAQATGGLITAYNSNGFTLGTADTTNGSSQTYVAWTFRKSKKFFDVLKYVGNGSSQNISHSLGSVPGMMIVKDLDGTGKFRVYHRSLGNTLAMELDGQEDPDDDVFWNDTTPTDAVFTVGNTDDTNKNNTNYVAYIFAHNNNDGNFGPDGDQDIISCGTYTGNTSTPPEITLGFEPQWILIKRTTSTADWVVFDNMRGVVNGSGDQHIRWDTNQEEEDRGHQIEFTLNGFKLGTANQGDSNSPTGATYIYMAIRRGQLTPPESANEVFAIDARTGSTPEYVSGFPVDFALIKDSNTSSDWIVNTRLLGNTFLKTNDSDALAADSLAKFDIQNGIRSDAVAGDFAWMWKRTKGYFDVSTYIGTGSALNVPHNLGVVPEMFWVKKTSNAASWNIYHSGTGNGKAFEFGSEAVATSSAFWNDTTPTESVFTVRNANNVGASGHTYVAFLFATLDGVSKVGSFTATGNDVNVDCGFTNGARFVLIKRTNSADDWFVFDTARGIVAGNDKRLKLNATTAEATADNIDPLSSGFTMTSGILGSSGNTFIFYAIA